MKNNKLKVIFVKAGSLRDNIKVMDIEHSLETFYELIECSCIDIVSRTINGRPVNIILDNEGLFVQNKVPSAIHKSNTRDFIFGNIIICGPTENSEVTSVPEDVIKEIEENTVYLDALLLHTPHRYLQAVVLDY